MGNRWTHRHTGTKTYNSWVAMRNRCLSPRNRGYPTYGAAGITVCERWLDFSNFLEDMGERPEGRSLDRIDNSKGYEPGNCRWATPLEQVSNRRCTIFLEYEGQRKTLTEWAQITGLKRGCIRSRLKSGKSVEDAFNPKTRHSFYKENKNE